MHAASWYLLTERADEIEVEVNGSKRHLKSAPVQNLCISFLRRRMRMIIRETSDMMRICMGLQDFLDACSDARDDCTVALTKDSKGKL